MGKLDDWTKSSFSNGSGGNNCVEVKVTDWTSDVLVRHSRVPFTWQAFSRDEWVAFVAGVKAGEFDIE